MDAFSVKIKISYPFILLSLFLISSCISGNLSQDDEKKISKEIVSIKNKYQKSDWEDKIRLIKNIGEYKNSKSHDIVLQFRITSYNVCYTKLLRLSFCRRIGLLRRMWPGDTCNPLILLHPCNM